MAFPSNGQPNLRAGAIERTPAASTVDPTLTLAELWTEMRRRERGGAPRPPGITGHLSLRRAPELEGPRLSREQGPRSLDAVDAGLADRQHQFRALLPKFLIQDVGLGPLVGTIWA